MRVPVRLHPDLFQHATRQHQGLITEVASNCGSPMQPNNHSHEITLLVLGISPRKLLCLRSAAHAATS